MEGSVGVGSSHTNVHVRVYFSIGYLFPGVGSRRFFVVVVVIPEDIGKLSGLVERAHELVPMLKTHLADVTNTRVRESGVGGGLRIGVTGARTCVDDCLRDLTCFTFSELETSPNVRDFCGIANPQRVVAHIHIADFEFR